MQSEQLIFQNLITIMQNNNLVHFFNMNIYSLRISAPIRFIETLLARNIVKELQI